MIIQLLLLFLSILLVWFSFKSFRGGVEYLRFFREELTKPPSEWEPMVTIIAPCKGVDEGMLANFDALLDQDLPEYEVIFVIDDADDPAAGVIEQAWQEAERHVKLVVAPKANGSSQKVENLREGVLHADPRSEVFVFVDSDARPSPGWLRALVAPLRDETIGAATGYRWFISEEPTLASELRSAWNASIASALGPNEKSNFTWGGSMAIRRDTFERIGMRDKWQSTLSDDFAVTRAMRSAGLRIHFVPQALTASVESCTFRELFEFTNRQMKITRVYMPQLWLMSFFGSGLFNLVMAAAILIAILSKANGVPVWAALATLFLVSFFSVGKAVLRLYAVRLALPQFGPELRRQQFSQYTLWLFTPAIFFANCVAALLSREIIWRGTRYRLVSHEATAVFPKHQ
ncbi:MAG: glycosyltransferase [Acidobacteria bacterium]|nr:glycosyltransferase [Acidobacteriota bacterium]